jgi:hypothetical protein
MQNGIRLFFLTNPAVYLSGQTQEIMQIFACHFSASRLDQPTNPADKVSA